MKPLKEILASFNRTPTDVVGIDVGTSAIKLVRMRQTGGTFNVVGAGLLPVPAPLAADQESLTPLEIPSKLKARYAALCFSAPSAVVKLLTFPGAFDERAEAKVADNMGLDEPDRYRIGYKLIQEGHARGESRVLTVAWAEGEAGRGTELIPAGLPVPGSLEVAGLATITAFLNASPEKDRMAATGLIDFGDAVTTYALFNRGSLALLRRFAFGTNALYEKVQSTLGVDRETARGIITDGSFDISQPLGEILDPLIKQFMVSRDFVERRENCRLGRLFISGGLSKSRDALEDIRASMDVELATWNPFDGLSVAKDAMPEDLVGQEWRLAAATGACLGVLQPS